MALRRCRHLVPGFDGLKADCVGDGLGQRHRGPRFRVGNSQLADAAAAFEEAPFQLDETKSQTEVRPWRRLFKIQIVSLGNDFWQKVGFGHALAFLRDLNAAASDIQLAAL